VAGHDALSLAPPTRNCVTGSGRAVGLGRISAIFTPLTVRALLDDGWSVLNPDFAFIMLMLEAAIAVAMVCMLARNTREQ
jgi:hypothetical protein